jgi:hypothetical protein
VVAAKPAEQRLLHAVVDARAALGTQRPASEDQTLTTRMPFAVKNCTSSIDAHQNNPPPPARAPPSLRAHMDADDERGSMECKESFTARSVWCPPHIFTGLASMLKARRKWDERTCRVARTSARRSLVTTTTADSPMVPGRAGANAGA